MRRMDHQTSHYEADGAFSSIMLQRKPARSLSSKTLSRPVPIVLDMPARTTPNAWWVLRSYKVQSGLT